MFIYRRICCIHFAGSELHPKTDSNITNVYVRNLENTGKPIYTGIRCNDKIRYNDNLDGTIP